MEFLVAVVIPVYNGAYFVEKAILSALQQPEVKEVIVVNDGSTDNSLSILEKLQQTYKQLKVYHHPNKENKGRSASRNVGIKRATQNFIAFLDADDFYLPNRFSCDKKKFEENAAVDGVYNAVGFHFYREVSAVEQKTLTLNTVTEEIQPEVLFEALISGKYGHFQIDGLTVKKSIFDATGLFNESLVVAEDTDIFWKMALKGRLATGIIEVPVAMRGVHESNIFNNKEVYNIYTIKMYESLVFWASKVNLPLSKTDLLLKWVWLLKFKQNNPLYKDIGYWFYLFGKAPRIILTHLSIKYFPLVRLRKKLVPFIFR